MSRPRFRAVVCLFLLAPTASSQETLPLLLKGAKARSIGPAVMSGRICEVAVYEKNPSFQYIATASGGVWKTTNHGTTWTPLFDKESTSAIGAVALCQTNPDIVWVGAGEANPRNSVSWGHGVFKSVDGGNTWQNMGLRETQHIGRIVIHPKTSDVVYVAALGRVWGPNKERGIFKTTDAGKTWQHCLALDEDTGCVDLAMDPEDPELLYACAWCVRRDAFSGGNPSVQTGPRAGIYQTKNGGKSWEKLSAGLPDRPFGRCGISIYRKDPRIVYAVVQTDKTIVTTQGQAADEKLELAAGGIFRSEDRGKTWKHINSLCPRPFYYGQIRVDPSDEARLYVLGIQFHQSNDGGKTFLKGTAAKGVHSDHHALWINPKASYHMVLGCDGGLNYSFDHGITWEYLKNLPISQFYAIGVDTRTPYRIYGGLQDNGTWGAPSATRDSSGISTADWTQLLGFDGYYCQIDPDEPDIVFCEGQYAILRRINLRNWDTVDIKPRLDGKDAKTKEEVKSNLVPNPGKSIEALRFNWSSPILLSKSKGKPLYFGGNFLFRSDDRGDTWKIISPDLTHGKPGISPYNGHTITTIAEAAPGTLYVGSDDGRITGTRDGGKNWEEFTVPGVPRERWISRLECSPSEAGVVYLAIDRHRNDDRKPYLFRSSDFGKNWESIAANLPEEGPVYAVKVDPLDPRRLLVGTEYGLFVSEGEKWFKYPGLPTVPVHDLVFADKGQDLVIGTHGRGIYILDMHALRSIEADKEACLCPIRAATIVRPKATRSLGIKHYYGENPPAGAVIDAFFRKPPPAEPTLVITNSDGKTVVEFKLPREAGLQRTIWNLQHAKTAAGVFNPVPPGTYTATLRLGETSLARDFNVEAER